LSIGTFLATLGIFKEVSEDFSGLYDLAMQLSATAGPLMGLTTIFNLQTDLASSKVVLDSTLRWTHDSRTRLMNNEAAAVKKTRFLTDQIPLVFENMSFLYNSSDTGEPREILKDVNLSCPQGNLVAIVGPHGSGRSSLLKLLGQVVFPTEGSVFVPTHLRSLHLAQEAVLLRDSPWRNLTFGLNDPSTADPLWIRDILEILDAQHTIELIEGEPRPEKPVEPPSESGCCGTGHAIDNSSSDSEGGESNSDSEKKGICEDWHSRITYTERVRIHLARAFIMNPEVLILQRPLYHFNKRHAGEITDIFKSFVELRGIGFGENDPERKQRRPRTLFFTLEDADQASRADLIFHLEFISNNKLPAKVSVRHPKHIESLNDDFVPHLGGN